MSVPTISQAEKDPFKIVAVIRQVVLRLNEIVGNDKRLAGDKVALTDGITAPSTISGIAQIYVDTADGDLKVKFGDGVVKTIVIDT